MPRSRAPYPAVFRQQMVDLVRCGRSLGDAFCGVCAVQDAVGMRCVLERGSKPCFGLVDAVVVRLGDDVVCAGAATDATLKPDASVLVDHADVVVPVLEGHDDGFSRRGRGGMKVDPCGDVAGDPSGFQDGRDPYSSQSNMNRGLRKIIKTRGAFPTDEAARKLLYLALLNLSRRWTRPLSNWKAAINQFIIMYEDRVPIT